MSTVALRRVLIIDSGMQGLSGHNFSYTQSVRQAFNEAGADVDVLVNRNFPSDLAQAHGFVPTFSYGAFDFAPGRGFVRDLRYVQAQSRVFAEQLEQSLRGNKDYDLVFSHTLGDFELIGWTRYLPGARLKGSLAIVLRQTPRYQNAAWWRRTFNPYWRLRPRSLGRMRRLLGRRFVLCTDSDALSEDYASIYPHSIVTLPIPLNPALYAPHPDSERSVSCRYGFMQGAPRRVGYLGEARSAKGFRLLPSLVRNSLASDEQVRFIVQCPSPSAGGESVSAGAYAELAELADRRPERLTLIRERLSNEDYADLARNLDIILIPYVHDHYRDATSGIFAEAVALGKPVVVPSHTWMARELTRAGTGVVFPRDDASRFEPAVTEVVRRYSMYQAAADRGREEWKAFHNAASLARLLLEAASMHHDELHLKADM
jgi:glycosyltransferase involved in cell wall biosynthesis